MQGRTTALALLVTLILFAGLSVTTAAMPPSATMAATYYVATDGQDVLPGGTSDHPWRTLQFAVDQVDPGDTILVRSGEYDGCRIERSGTAGAWITLQAAPDATVRVTAPGPNNRHNSNIEVETWEGDGMVSYWIIAGLEVSGAPSWGIDVRGGESSPTHHITIRGNRVHDNGLDTGRTGIFLAFVDDAVIEHNESYGNGEHGIYCSNSGDRPTVRGNILHNNRGCGLHMNGDLSMGGDGTISDGLVEQNVIYENGTSGGAAINMDGVETTIVRNNLLYGNHAGGIAIFQGNGAICSSGNRVLNNTIVMPADGRWAVNIGEGGCVDNQLYNNIILTHHSFRGCITIPEPHLSGFESDYNVVMDRFSTDGDSTIITLAQWQSQGYDSHSFNSTSDLIFLDEAGADYHLLPTSPARDAGTTLADVLDDLEGVARPWGSAYDIGAYEYHQQAADFALQASPALRSILPGGTATYTLTLSAQGGFSGTVTLLATSPSPSLTLQVNPTGVVPPAVAILTIQDGHEGTLLPGQWYTLPITATGGSITHSTSVDLLVGGTQVYVPLLSKGAPAGWLEWFYRQEGRIHRK